MRVRRGRPARAALACAALALAAACAATRVAAADAPFPDVVGSDSAAAVPRGSVADSSRLVRAEARFGRGRYAAAAALLAPALEPDAPASPDSPAELELLGRARVRVGDVEGAVLAFTRLLDRSPRWMLDPRRVSDDERAVFTRARIGWRAAHPDEVRAEAEEDARRAAFRPWWRQRRYQVVSGAVAVVLGAVIRHQMHDSGATAPLPELPQHP